MNPGFPVVLYLTGVPCLVVGGGALATRRIASLLEAGADITVISPIFSEQIGRWIAEKKINGIQKRYESSDGEGAALIFAATNDDAVNEQIVADAYMRQQWVNAPGELEARHFLIPAVLERGKLQIAVSTSGASPALSASIRDEIASLFGDELSPYVDFLYEVRTWIKEQIHDNLLKNQMLQELGATDWIQWARLGKPCPSAAQWIQTTLQKYDVASDEE